MPKQQRYTDAELEAEDRALAAREDRYRRFQAMNEKLEAAGLDLDELIELIEARQNLEY